MKNSVTIYIHVLATTIHPHQNGSTEYKYYNTVEKYFLTQL